MRLYKYMNISMYQYIVSFYVGIYASLYTYILNEQVNSFLGKITYFLLVFLSRSISIHTELEA